MNSQKFDFAIAATLPIYQNAVDYRMNRLDTKDPIPTEDFATAFQNIFLEMCEAYDEMMDQNENLKE